MAKRSNDKTQFNVVFRQEPEGGFTVLVPALPGCVSYGKTLQEAKQMAQDAIAGYIASLQKHGESIPSDEGSFISTVPVLLKSSFAHA